MTLFLEEHTSPRGVNEAACAQFLPNFGQLAEWRATVELDKLSDVTLLQSYSLELSSLSVSVLAMDLSVY